MEEYWEKGVVRLTNNLTKLYSSILFSNLLGLSKEALHTLGGGVMFIFLPGCYGGVRERRRGNFCSCFQRYVIKE